ncbi:hypothetical protein ACCS67_08540 [Rhizobium brockwellii]|uniref:hypothetical protein n=1 Tax=Rhizobium brockwellii TaxID=3019932 RepID=UPI003F98DC11
MTGEPKISPEVDRALDALDANCVEWCVIRPPHRKTLAIVFELSPDPLASEAHFAMTTLTRLFDSNPIIAEAIVEYAAARGQIYCSESLEPAPECGAGITASARQPRGGAYDLN